MAEQAVVTLEQDVAASSSRCALADIAHGFRFVPEGFHIEGFVHNHKRIGVHSKHLAISAVAVKRCGVALAVLGGMWAAWLFMLGSLFAALLFLT